MTVVLTQWAHHNGIQKRHSQAPFDNINPVSSANTDINPARVERGGEGRTTQSNCGSSPTHGTKRSGFGPTRAMRTSRTYLFEDYSSSSIEMPVQSIGEDNMACS
jgi:hypothetical protein